MNTGKDVLLSICILVDLYKKYLKLMHMSFKLEINQYRKPCKIIHFLNEFSIIDKNLSNCSQTQLDHTRFISVINVGNQFL